MRETFLAQINVTRDCNLRCQHCYIHSETKRSSGSMSPERLAEAVRGVVHYLNRTPSYLLADIHIIGGEPTQLGLDYYHRALPMIYTELANLKCQSQLRLVTNLLAPESVDIARLFERVSTSYEVVTRFSKPIHLERWVERVTALQSEGRVIQATVTLTKPVVQYGAVRILDDLMRVGLKQIHFAFFVPSGDGLVHQSLVEPTHDECSQFLIDAANWYHARRDITSGLLLSPIESLLASFETGEAIDDVVCPILSGSVDINWNGDSGSCLQTGGNPGAVQAGNIFEVPLHTLMNGLSIKREILDARRPKAVCNHCDHYSICLGACGVMHRYWTGEGECPGFKRFLDHLYGMHLGGFRSAQGEEAQLIQAKTYMATRQ